MNKLKQLMKRLVTFKNKEDDIYEKEEHVWFMPKTVILDELQVRRYVLFTSALICLLLAVLIIWAFFASIDEVAVTFGEIVTSTKVSQIQHLEGGIVKNIYVKEGQEVTKNQLLASLDDTAAKAELQELQARKASLIADIDRLHAFMGNRKFNEKNINTDNLNPDKEDQATVNDIIKGDETQLSLETQSQRNQREILIAQIKQKQNEIEKLQNQLALIEKNKVLLVKEFAMYQKLVKKEYVSKIEYSMKEREVNQLESDRANLVSELDKAKNTLAEYKVKLDEVGTSIEKDAVTNLNKASDELLQVQYALNKLNDKVKRENVYSPIAGVVKGIEAVPGGVITPNGTLMTVVPSHQILQVEARINTLDIGHIHVGDPARVKILTYDYARYGNIEGTLTEISATTFFDEVSKAPYYKGVIELKEQYVRDKKNSLRAGMTVQADIVTGYKTVMQYLVKPIYANMQGAFHER